MHESRGLNDTDLIEMSGVFPASLIKRQVLILAAIGGGGEHSLQTNRSTATTLDTAILTGLDSLIE